MNLQKQSLMSSSKSVPMADRLRKFRNQSKKGSNKYVGKRNDNKGLNKEGKLFDKVRIGQCHGAEKQKGGVRLDTLEAALKSKNGKVVAPGKSAESQVVISIAQMAKNEDENMPPKGKGDPFTKEQVGLVRAWIDQGAK